MAFLTCWIFIESHFFFENVYIYIYIATSIFCCALENLIFESAIKMVSILWLWAFEGCIKVEFPSKNGNLKLLIWFWNGSWCPMKWI